MSVISQFKTLGQFIFDLVFPINCAGCGREGRYLCAACLPKLKKFDNQICIVCRQPSPYGKTHTGCVSKNTIDGIVSALSYKDPLVKRVIELFKYKFIQELSEDLAAALLNEISAQGLGDYFREFILIPVPLHKKRFNWRGFNQAELLAASLAKINGIETNTDLIIRSKNTKPQTKLSATERKQNLTDAFREQAAQIAGKKFLLVDDVVTTGATLNELAKLLKKSKAQEVWAVTVAHG